MSNQSKTASDHDAFLVLSIVTIVLALGLLARYVLAG